MVSLLYSTGANQADVSIYIVFAAMAEKAEIEIKASQWRLVEVGRVVLFTHGQYTGCLAAIVEIIDHKRVRLDIRVFLLICSA